MKLSTLALAIALCTSTTVMADWETTTDLSLVSQSGNTEQENTLIKTTWTKKSDQNAYTVNGEYINSTGEAEGDDVRLAESARAGLKYNRELSKKVSSFLGALWEKNRFAGFENRYSGDLGSKYEIYKTEKISFFNETGYRYRSQYEYLLGEGQGPKTESHFARVYFEYKNKLNKTSNLSLWIENLFDFENSDNYEVNFEPSIDVDLGEFFSSSDRPARVSLKVAYKGMYDNVPAADGLKRYDSIFSTGITVLY